jgi:hypothetical protein
MRRRRLGRLWPRRVTIKKLCRLDFLDGHEEKGALAGGP